MKMRDLEARTNVNRETIRVYLRHGLIPEPSRPKRNVADYGDEHIRAVLVVRDLQQNTGLTLNQIKATLTGDHTSRRVEASAFQNLEELVATRVGIDVKPVLIKSIAKAFPDAEEIAVRLKSIGIVDIIKTKNGNALSITDSRLVTIWSEMRQAGFNEEHAFTPEMLTFYLKPAEAVASTEAKLFLERVEGVITEEDAAAMLQIGLRLMLDFFGLIRTKKLMENIRDARERRRPKSAPARRR